MTLFLSLLLVLTSYQEQKLLKTQVNDNISMLIPETFRPMTDDEIVGKYFTLKRPMAIYTDVSQKIDLGINQTITTWNESDLEIMMKFQKSNILSLYDEVNILSEGTKEVNGKKFGYIEFESVIKGDEASFKDNTPIKKYSYIQYVIISDQSLLFNFTAPLGVKSQWQASIIEIMESINIKGNLK
jgi:hypothetical protein